MRNNIARVLSYVLDWVIIVVAVVVFQRIGQVAGHRQRFSVTDITIKYEYTGGSTIPNYLNVILSVIFPALTILILHAILETRLRKRERAQQKWSVLYTIDTSWLGLALSICLSQVFTNVLKITIGRPRPDLLARCVPDSNAMDAIPYGLSTSEICTQTDSALLNDGFRSFPSGHSSLAFSGLAYLTLFLAWRLSIFNRKGHSWKWVVIMLPISIASLVAISRVKDNRHHPFDVLFGSAIGIVTSFVGFYQYFPKLGRAHNRFPIRYSESTDIREGNDEMVTQHSRDDTTQNVPLDRYHSDTSQHTDWSAEQDIVPEDIPSRAGDGLNRPLIADK